MSVYIDVDYGIDFMGLGGKFGKQHDSPTEPFIRRKARYPKRTAEAK